jgi:hypothetical protein
MARFSAAIALPSGEAPGFGDDDGVRVLPLAERAPREHAHLPDIVAALCAEPRLRRANVPCPAEALWLGGRAALARFEAVSPAQPAPAVALRTSGVAILRAGDDAVALRCGPVGQCGVGGHAHNDQLSIVVQVGARPLIVEPGTGFYTADPLIRDRFRGTAAHATVVVDAEEQTPLPARAFALFGPGGALGEVREDHAEGTHHGYARLPGRVIHKRAVTLDRAARAVVITDRLAGDGRHEMSANFPLAPMELRAHLGDRALARLDALALSGWAVDGFVRTQGVEFGPSDAPLAALVPVGVGVDAVVLAPGWLSPAYGEVVSAPRVRYVWGAPLPAERRFALVFLSEVSA